MNKDVKNFVDDLKATSEALDQAGCLCQFQKGRLAEMLLRAARLIEFQDKVNQP